MRRRTLLAATAGGTAALAGCLSSVMDWIASFVLEDVTLFNETNQTITGMITVVDPNGDATLDTSFELPPREEDDEAEDSDALHENVLTSAGSYEVQLTVDDPIEGVDEVSETVTVSDPDEEYIVIPLGPDDIDDPIDVFVIEEFTDIKEIVDEG